MKNKPLLLFIFLLSFFICLNNAIFAAQNDFYGIWIGNTTDETVLDVRFTISASTLAMETEVIENNKKRILQEGTVEITGWAESVNADAKTKDDFPNGFILKTKAEYGHISSLIIYISSDKKQFIIPSLNELAESVIIFIKKPKTSP
jgi:hypothetical protein